jgi:hypothetical protein
MMSDGLVSQGMCHEAMYGCAICKRFHYRVQVLDSPSAGAEANGRATGIRQAAGRRMNQV